MDLNKFSLAKPEPEFNRLPVEILEEIIHYAILEHKAKKVLRDLLSLSRVSKWLRPITIPFLYRHNVKYMGSSGLGWAASHQERPLLEALMSYGARISSKKAGYPLLELVKKGDSDTLEFLLVNSTNDEVKEAIEQKKIDLSVLVLAVFNADVPCVKVLLDASTKAGFNARLWKEATEYILQNPRKDLVGHYIEITDLLLAKHPLLLMSIPYEYSEVMESVDFDLDFGRTTPLISAAKRGCVKIMKMIIDTCVSMDHRELLVYTVNENFIRREHSALRHMCKTYNWPSDQEGCDQHLAGTKLLLQHGASNVWYPYSMGSDIYALKLGCKSVSIITIHNIRLQCGMIRALIEDSNLTVEDSSDEDGAIEYSPINEDGVVDEDSPINEDGMIEEDGLDEDDYDWGAYNSADEKESRANSHKTSASRKFLKTVARYILNAFATTPLARPLGPENSDVLIYGETSTEITIRLDLGVAPPVDPNTSSNSDSVEDESRQVFEMLQETFETLVKTMKGKPANGVDQCFRRTSMTLLYWAASIPGIFGVCATLILLQHGADVYQKNWFECSTLDFVAQENRNPAAVSLLKLWPTVKKDAAGKTIDVDIIAREWGKDYFRTFELETLAT